MKRIILSVVALVAFASTKAVAQQQVKFGPKAGVNFSNISGLDNAETKTGFHVGAVAEIKFNEKFSIQPEVVYSAQGAKFTGSYPLIGNVEAKFNYDYINIPILAKYYFVDGFSVEAGPQIGFLVKAEDKVTNGSTEVTNDVKNNLNSTSFGLGFGLAYDLPMGVFINGRYNLGLSDIVKNNNNNAQKNSVIQIGIGYKFE